MPEMYTVQKMVHIRILEFADHTRLVIKTTVVSIFKHCGKAFNPLELKGADIAKAAAQTANGPISDSLQAAAAGNVALHGATFTTAEKIIGLTIIGMISTLVLVTLALIGTFIYRRVTNQVEYMSLKQVEAGLDEEETVGEAAPAYDIPAHVTTV